MITVPLLVRGSGLSKKYLHGFCTNLMTEEIYFNWNKLATLLRVCYHAGGVFVARNTPGATQPMTDDILTDAELQARRDRYNIDSLGKLIDKGYNVALYCEAPRDPCGFIKWVDLPKLAEHLGRDHGCLHDDLVPHLWCTKCGGKAVAIRLHPPTLPQD
jgi:hypothetical protein